MIAAGRTRPARRERSGQRALRALALLWLGALIACGKACSCGDEFLAQLESFQGEVQRDQAASVGTWSEVARGERFHMGDGLRTGRAGNAQLTLAGDGVALVESNTVLRFVDRDPRGKSRFELEEGVVRIASGAFDVDVATPHGLARLRQGSSVRFVSSDDDTQFDVLVGQVAIDQAGQVTDLAAGQQLLLSRPRERAVPPDADANARAPQDGAVGRDQAAPALRLPAAAQAPPAAEVSLTLPEIDSLTLHAPTLPITFRVQPAPCKPDSDERPNADLDGHAATLDGRGLLLALARPGTHRLNLRCDRRLVRQTTLHVLRDAATLELPKSAQRVDVEADGRRYTVRYQNVIPVVRMHWSDAVPSSRYTLVLKRGMKEQRYQTDQPSRDLPGVELMEGNYDFWFTAASGQKSDLGGLRIEFDNTARALSLSEPSDGATADRDQVTVSGVALLRTQVTANGVALPLDGKGRFRAQVPLNTERSILVRAIHPAAGVHYYLRRLR